MSGNGVKIDRDKLSLSSQLLDGAIIFVNDAQSNINAGNRGGTYFSTGISDCVSEVKAIKNRIAKLISNVDTANSQISSIVGSNETDSSLLSLSGSEAQSGFSLENVPGNEKMIHEFCLKTLANNKVALEKLEKIYQEEYRNKSGEYYRSWAEIYQDGYASCFNELEEFLPIEKLNGYLKSILRDGEKLVPMSYELLIEKYNSSEEGKAWVLDVLKQSFSKYWEEVQGIPLDENTWELYESYFIDNFVAINNITEELTNDLLPAVEMANQIATLGESNRNLEIASYGYILQLPGVNEYTTEDLSKYLDENELHYLEADEAKIYTYLINNQNYGQAERYMELMEEVINQRKGLENASKFIEKIVDDGNWLEDYFRSCDKGFWRGVQTFGEGFVNLIHPDGKVSASEYEQMFIMQFLSQNFNLEDIKSKYGDKSEEYQLYSKMANLSWWNASSAEWGYSSSVSIGNMVPSILLGSVGGSWTPAVGQALGLGSMGLSVMGNTVESNYQRGASGFEAYFHAGLVALSEVSLEYFIGGVPGLSKLSDFTLGTFIGEGIEEFAQTYIEAGLNNRFWGDEFDLETLFPESLYAFAQGVFISAVLNGGTTTINLGVNGLKTITTSEISYFTNVDSNGNPSFDFKRFGEYLLGTAELANGNNKGAIENFAKSGYLSSMESSQIQKMLENIDVKALNKIIAKVDESSRKLIYDNLSADVKKSLDNLEVISESVETITETSSESEVSTPNVSVETTETINTDTVSESKEISNKVESAINGVIAKNDNLNKMFDDLTVPEIIETNKGLPDLSGKEALTNLIIEKINNNSNFFIDIVKNGDKEILTNVLNNSSFKNLKLNGIGIDEVAKTFNNFIDKVDVSSHNFDAIDSFCKLNGITLEMIEASSDKSKTIKALDKIFLAVYPELKARTNKSVDKLIVDKQFEGNNMKFSLKNGANVSIDLGSFSEYAFLNTLIQKANIFANSLIEYSSDKIKFRMLDGFKVEVEINDKTSLTKAFDLISESLSLKENNIYLIEYNSDKTTVVDQAGIIYDLKNGLSIKQIMDTIENTSDMISKTDLANVSRIELNNPEFTNIIIENDGSFQKIKINGKISVDSIKNALNEIKINPVEAQVSSSLFLKIFNSIKSKINNIGKNKESKKINDETETDSKKTTKKKKFKIPFIRGGIVLGSIVSAFAMPNLSAAFGALTVGAIGIASIIVPRIVIYGVKSLGKITLNAGKKTISKINFKTMFDGIRNNFKKLKSNSKVKPTDVKKPSEPTKPTKTKNPVEPTKPTEVKKPAEPTKKTEIKKIVHPLIQFLLGFTGSLITISAIMPMIYNPQYSEDFYLKLYGDTNINLPLNNVYQEPGYKAYDRKDGDLTDKVVVEGVVNYKKLGSYVLTYTVTNSRGETISKSRVVNIIRAGSGQYSSDGINIWENGEIIEITLDDFNDQIEKGKVYDGIKINTTVLLNQYINKFMLQNRLVYAMSLSSIIKANNQYASIYNCDRNYVDTEASGMIVTNGTIERIYNKDNACFANYGVFYFTKNKLHHTKVTSDITNQQIIDSKTRNTFVYQDVLVDNSVIVNNTMTTTSNYALCQSSPNTLKVFTPNKTVTYQELGEIMVANTCQTGILLTEGNTIVYKSQYSSTFNIQRGLDSETDSIIIFNQKTPINTIK